MRVTERRLSEALTADEPGSRLSETNPVAALIIESAAATYPEHAEQVREAGRFLCDLLGSPEAGGAPKLTAPVAINTYNREEHTRAEQMRAHLARATHRDLLLGLATHALLSRSLDHRLNDPETNEGEAVLRTLYLLVRMFETQEETDALERALKA